MGKSLEHEFAEAEAVKVLAQLKITGLPICPFEIAKQKDIKIQEGDLANPGFSGCLMKVGDVFGILYSNHIKNEGYARFTVAHELGHYFLPGHPDALFADGKSRHFSKMGFGSRDKHEREADAFASSLLMPRGMFVQEMGKLTCGYLAIEALSKIFNTSLLATAIRYANFSDDSVAIVVSTADTIEYCFVSQSLKDIKALQWLKRGSPVPKGSATWTFNKNIENVHGGRKKESGTVLESWFDGAPRLEVNEDIVGLGIYGKTLTVLFTDEVIGEDAESFEDDEESDDDSMSW